MSGYKFKQLRENCIRMTHGLISSFDSVTCRKAILSNDLGSQAFSFLVNGTAVLRSNKPQQSTIESFVGDQTEATGIPFRLIDYLELVDWSGRIISQSKRGRINASLPPILERLSFNEDAWKTLTTKFEQQFNQWVGSEHIVKQIYSSKHYQRIPSTARHKALLG